MPRVRVEPGEKVENGRVAFWEKDARHNDAGEVYLVGGDEPIVVYETPAVKEAVAQERLTRLERVSSGSVSRSARRQQEAPDGTEPPDEPESPLAFLTATQRANLTAKGFDTDEKIFEADDEDLDEVEGVGEGTIKNIRTAQAEAEANTGDGS